jgi:putative phosphoribosyl transferase
MFEDRIEAGKQLAVKLKNYKNESPLVVALPRGGVAVGFPIAKALHAPLEVEIVRKLGAPQNVEVGIGAIAEDGVEYLNKDMLDYFQISNVTLRLIQQRERTELERRKKLYRGGKPLGLLTNRSVILVDDGLATGVTACAAILSLKKHHPKKIIFAVPVCAQSTAEAIFPLIDSIICIEHPDTLDAIGRYYQNFRQVTDEEVLIHLRRINAEMPSPISIENDFGQKIVW